MMIDVGWRDKNICSFWGARKEAQQHREVKEKQSLQLQIYGKICAPHTCSSAAPARGGRGGVIEKEKLNTEILCPGGVRKRCLYVSQTFLEKVGGTLNLNCNELIE